MSEVEVVDVSRTAILLFVLIGGGWVLGLLALLDAVRRRARGNEATGTWVVFLGVSLLIVPLAGVLAVAYGALVVVRERRRTGDADIAGVGIAANRSSRLLAFGIDVLVLLLPVSALTWRLATIDVSEGVFDAPGWVPWLGAGCSFLYQVVPIALWGQTLGKRVVGVRVVGRHGARPSWSQALRRTAPVLVGVVPYLGLLAVFAYLPVLWRQDRRGLHDFAAGTFVIVAETAPDRHRARWVAATVASLVGWGLVAFTGGGAGSAGTIEVRTNADDAPEHFWSSGLPHAENMARARSVVEQCLGSPLPEVGEPNYDYTAMPLEDVRTRTDMGDIDLRVIGRDDDCDTGALATTSVPRSDRVNVYVVGGRVVWARTF